MVMVLFKKRKGSIYDLGGILVLLLALVISGFLAETFINSFAAEAANATIGLPNSTNATGAITDAHTAVQTINGFIPMIVFFAALGAAIMAWFVPTHPIFFPISIILFAIFILLSTMFSNILWQFMTSANILPVAQNYNLIVQLIQNLPTLITVAGVIIIVFMYSKDKGGVGW
jgi:hypothetical protein